MCGPRFQNETPRYQDDAFNSRGYNVREQFTLINTICVYEVFYTAIINSYPKIDPPVYNNISS